MARKFILAAIPTFASE